ncbi:DUF1501 domain-containing protein [Naumannella sp. ID2617S]|nr:DUF1501 domain-containing protein [Naumannella sp. ID2617S]
MRRPIHAPANDLGLHEDVLTPMHHHQPGKDFLLAHDDDGVRPVTVDQAVELARARRSPGVDEVDQLPDGPRGIRRRSLLAAGSVGLGAMLMPSAGPRLSFAATPGNRDLLVVVFLRGGFDGLSAVVPVADPAYYAARPGIGVRPEHTFALDSRFGMNQNLAPLKPLWDARQLAVVVGAGNPGVTRSHFDDQVSCELAAPANQRTGWIARHLALASAELGTFRAISIGGQVALSLTTTAFDTLAMSGVKEFDLYSWGALRPRMMGSLSALYANSGGFEVEQSRLLMSAIDRLGALREQTYVPAGGAVYEANRFATGLRDIAQLAKAEIGLEAVTIDSQDWDMHRGLGRADVATDWFARQATELSRALAAFATDLGPRWNSTTVVLISEFGRRVTQNGDLGVDHGHGNTLWLLGGGINGGVFGSQPALAAANLQQGAVPITTDYRTVLAEVISKRLGNTRTGEVFPGWSSTATPLGVARAR